jgi:Flp pilus assembly pilin Flp
MTPLLKLSMRTHLGRRQRGAVATEFALIFIVFMALVIAVIEFARVMFIYSTAVEATRLGARIAVVCSTGDTAHVKARMKDMLTLLEPANIDIAYPTPGCSAKACEPVTVRIQGLTVKAAIPLVPLSFPIPAFSTSLPSESLSSTNNPICS